MVTAVRSQLRHAADAESFAVIACCFMPDHLHALVEGRREDAQLPFVKRFKQCSSFDWKGRAGGILWQRSYFERVLRADEGTVAAARYVLNNPVRVGVVEAPSDYPFSGSFLLDMRELLDSMQD